MDAITDTTTRYYYDDQRVVLRTQISGGVETDGRMFVFGNYIDEVLVMRLPVGAAPGERKHEKVGEKSWNWFRVRPCAQKT